MAHYLITGGAGFIGSNIAHSLALSGETVRVVDNFSTGYRANLNGISSAIEIVEADLRDLEACRQAVKGVDYVLHQAALPSVPRSVDDPVASHEANTTGTLNLLVAAREKGVKRLVCASSSSVYGNSPALPKSEDMMPWPLSPYAISKLAAEQYCQNFADIYGLETVCLRYFNVFGPRQSANSQYAAVIPKFIQAMLAGERPVIYGDGNQSRDFTYVENVVDANMLAHTQPGVSGRVFNIACGQRYSLLELVDMLNDILGIRFEPIFQEARQGDVKHSQAEIWQAQSRLFYEPSVGFQVGLEETVAWYERHLQAV